MRAHKCFQYHKHNIFISLLNEMNYSSIEKEHHFYVRGKKETIFILLEAEN